MTPLACARTYARAWALCAALGLGLGLLAGCAGTPPARGDASGPLYKRSSGPQGNAVTDEGGGSSGVTVYGEIDLGVSRRR